MPPCVLPFLSVVVVFSVVVFFLSSEGAFSQFSFVFFLFACNSLFRLPCNGFTFFSRFFLLVMIAFAFQKEKAALFVIEHNAVPLQRCVLRKKEL